MITAGYEVMPAYNNSVEDNSTGDADSSLGTGSKTESLPSETPKVENGGEASVMDEGGDFSGVMLAEVESNTKEWQVVSPGAGGVSGVGITGR